MVIADFSTDAARAIPFRKNSLTGIHTDRITRRKIQFFEK